MQCPSCGHSNDPGNRFCEYCGARLEPSVVQEATVPGPPPFATDASYDAPTMFVPTDQSAPAAEAATPAAPAEGAPVCGVCGYTNQPGDRFCDQCGASLQNAQPAPAAQSAPAEAAAEQPEQTGSVEPPPPIAISSDPRAKAAEEPPVDVAAAVAPDTSSDAPTPPGGTPMPNYDAPAAVAEQPASEPTAASDQAVLEGMVLESAPADASAPAAPAAPADADADAERARLEAAIQEHRDNLAMFEQMAARYDGRDVPAHIQTGRDESQRALADAEARLADFDAAQSAAALPDPAEVERLNNAIQEHRDNLAMFEQMAARYDGRDVPAHIQTGLDESRAALAQAQADLAALQGEPKATPTEPAPEPHIEQQPEPAPEPHIEQQPEPAPEPHIEQQPTPEPHMEQHEAAQPAAPAAEAAPTVEPEPIQPPPAVPTQPAASQAHLLVESSGATLNLPTDKAEIIIGREDPISGIFPDIDLTSHGGETGGVSRQHARILHQGTTWQLEDLNSTNYTRINGTKLAPHTPAEIKAGDTLTVGRVNLKFNPA